MKIKSYDAKFDELIQQDAAFEVLGDTFSFTEGPVWNSNDGILLFSDIPENRIYSWNPENGIGVYRKNSHYSNGLTYDPDRNLIACEHESRSITREVNSNKVEHVVGFYDGKKLNSPNDVVCASDGSIIFSDPIYGLRIGMGGPAEQELSFQGLFRVPPDSNEAVLITDSFERPNGVAFSPDETQLYVTDTVRQHIRIFNIKDGWQFSSGAVWAELWDDDHGGRPDGIKLDYQGNVFSTGPGGIWIFTPEAALIGRILLPEKTSNLAWGEDGHTLFITSSSKVYRLRCETHGLIPGA